MLVDVKFGTTTRQLHHYNPRAMLGREDLVPAQTNPYWKALHVAAEDTVPMVNKRGEPVSDNAATGAEAYHVVSPGTTACSTVKSFDW